MTSGKQKRQDESGDGSWVFRGRFYRVLGSKVHALGKKNLTEPEIWSDGADEGASDISGWCR